MEFEYKEDPSYDDGTYFEYASMYNSIWVL